MAGELDDPGNQGQLPRTDRRVARTKAAIEEAFAALVNEHGYENVTVEEIAMTADVAKATFYAHYDNKAAVLHAVFSRLTQERVERISYREGPWTGGVRRSAVRYMYEHAGDQPDIYKVCLGDPVVRASYAASLARAAEDNIDKRLAALGRQPRVSVPVMSRAFAAGLVGILEAWLEGEIEGSAHEVADMALDVVVAGVAWGQRVTLEELGYLDD